MLVLGYSATKKIASSTRRRCCVPSWQRVCASAPRAREPSSHCVTVCRSGHRPSRNSSAAASRRARPLPHQGLAHSRAMGGAVDWVIYARSPVRRNRRRTQVAGEDEERLLARGVSSNRGEARAWARPAPAARGERRTDPTRTPGWGVARRASLSDIGAFDLCSLHVQTRAPRTRGRTRTFLPNALR